MLQEQEGAVVDARQAGAEAAVEALIGVFLLDLVGDHLPLDAERRVSQQVVELLAVEGILGERVAERDLGVLSLHHEIRAADRVGLLVQLLAGDAERGVRVQLAEPLLGGVEHAAGAAGRVEHGLHDAGFGQVRLVGEQQVHHQANDLARGEVLTGGLVGQLGESADQLLE